MARPLDGITVVSLEHAIAAPFCTRQLADLGARVIKVERPGGGDFARDYDRRAHGLSSHFVWVNRSKESLTLDLKQPQALQALAELHEGAAPTPEDARPAVELIDELAALERWPRCRAVATSASSSGASLPARARSPSRTTSCGSAPTRSRAWSRSA